MVVFCVKQGFGISDTRNLFIDDFRAYYNEIIYTLEQSGEIKEGTYKKITNTEKTEDVLASLVKAFNQTKTK